MVDKRKNKGVLYVRNIPEPVKRRFKAILTGKGQTMTQAVTAWMLDVIHAEEPNAVKDMRRRMKATNGL